MLVLVGRNGAGKSTTLKAIMGLLPDVAGGVRFTGSGDSRLGAASNKRVWGLAMFWERRIFTDLTVAENRSRTSPGPRAGDGCAALDGGAGVRAVPQARQ